MTLAVIALVAGVLTVFSPCVLPLLPVIVGGSVAQVGERSWRRAAVVTAALGVSVFAFTFLLKVSTALIGVPQAAWSWLSGGILFVVGVFFIFPNLWDLLPGTAKANRDSTALMSKGFMRQSVAGDVLVGAALGPVFTTCSPTYFVVLATVLPASFGAGMTDIFLYTLGLCATLLVVTVVGQHILERLGVATSPGGWLRKVIGALFIAIAILIVTGTLASVEAPLYSIFDETKVEGWLLSPHKTSTLATTTESTVPASVATSSVPTPVNPGDLSATLAAKAKKYQLAPALAGIDGYLNTDGKPITLAQYRGKNIVLIDFWTYSCINCVRTLPYVTSWYSKYKDEGLVIIGVHTPEFAFEHVESNVAAALKQFGITYPVVLDNEYQTWNAFGNQYWPREYLVDIDGYIVHDHAGEGEYDVTEQAIQAALAERAARLEAHMPATTTVAITPKDLSGVGSPETYFGASRNEYLGNGAAGQTGRQTLTLPATVEPNTLYLSGSWDFDKEFATSQAVNAAVEYAYKATDVYFVASAASPVQIQVMQDGKPVGAAGGADVKNSMVTIGASRLYHLVHNKGVGIHTLKLIIKAPGLAAYTFTFG